MQLCGNGFLCLGNIPTQNWGVVSFVRFPSALLSLPSFQGHNFALLHRESKHTVHSGVGGEWSKMHGRDGDRGATGASTKDGIGLATIVAKPFLGIQV